MSPVALFGQSMLSCWKPCRARVERVVDARSLSRRDVVPCSFRVYGAERTPPGLAIKADFKFTAHSAAPRPRHQGGFSPLRIGLPVH